MRNLKLIKWNKLRKLKSQILPTKLHIFYRSSFQSLLHLIKSLFLITSYTILFDLCKEKLDVDQVPGAERVKVLLRKAIFSQLPTHCFCEESRARNRLSETSCSICNIKVATCRLRYGTSCKSKFGTHFLLK